MSTKTDEDTHIHHQSGRIVAVDNDDRLAVDVSHIHNTIIIIITTTTTSSNNRTAAIFGGCCASTMGRVTTRDMGL